MSVEDLGEAATEDRPSGGSWASGARLAVALLVFLLGLVLRHPAGHVLDGHDRRQCRDGLHPDVRTAAHCGHVRGGHRRLSPTAAANRRPALRSRDGALRPTVGRGRAPCCRTKCPGRDRRCPRSRRTHVGALCLGVDTALDGGNHHRLRGSHRRAQRLGAAVAAEPVAAGANGSHRRAELLDLPADRTRRGRALDLDRAGDPRHRRSSRRRSCRTFKRWTHRQHLRRRGAVSRPEGANHRRDDRCTALSLSRFRPDAGAAMPN